MSESEPDYKYLIKAKRYHKSKFRSDKNISEIEKTTNFYKVWDCGKIKFELLN